MRSSPKEAAISAPRTSGKAAAAGSTVAGAFLRKRRKDIMGRRGWLTVAHLRHADHPVLLAVLAAEKLAHLGLQLSVVRMDGRAQRGFRGTALPDSLENALHVAHPVRVADIFHRRQGLRIGDCRLDVGEPHKAAFEHVVRNLALRAE